MKAGKEFWPRRRVTAGLRGDEAAWARWREFTALADRLGAPFADHLRKRADWISYAVFCRLAAAVAPRPDGLVVDWGGQYGQVTRLLMDAGLGRVVNYLVYPPPHYESFEAAFGLTTVHGRHPNRIDLPDGAAMMVISSGVLEHVTEDGVGREDVLLGEIRRVLEPGGLFVVWNLPARLSLSEMAAAAWGGFRHARRFSPGEAEALLGAAGLEVLLVERHKFLPGSLLSRLMARWEPALVHQADDWLSRRWPLSLVARDFALVARKSSA